ncbi:hypothetical protein RJ55_07779 [Drechmeria coniospora]|nr:hypothetical protein RJ55_07779 [Drechmeria coniospora]
MPALQPEATCSANSNIDLPLARVTACHVPSSHEPDACFFSTRYRQKPWSRRRSLSLLRRLVHLVHVCRSNMATGGRGIRKPGMHKPGMQTHMHDGAARDATTTAASLTFKFCRGRRV